MIPAVAHFVWIGPHLPWAYVYSLRSAAARGSLDAVVLHHVDELAAGPELQLLLGTPNVTLTRLSVESWMQRCDEQLGSGSELRRLYSRVTDAVARSNILRAAVLLLDGGIYLDLDTITVASLQPLLADRQFLGLEHIVWPRDVRRSPSRVLRYKSLMLSTIRDGLRRMPRGYKWFRAIAPYYYQAINGAVAGAEAGSPLMAKYLDAMLRLPEAQQHVKHGLGTHLLQQVVEAYQAQDLTIHPPETFYPLAPEISEHWFRATRDADLSQALSPNTLVAHWYASARAKPYLTRLTPEYVRENAQVQLYCALARPFVD